MFNLFGRYLNPDNELRKIFGSRVLHGDSSYRRRAHGPSYKGVWLSQPQNNWPKLGRAGIDMQLIKKQENRHGLSNCLALLLYNLY